MKKNGSASIRRILDQSVKDVEIVIVDNGSRDRTVEKGKLLCPQVKVVSIEDYRPGLAINRGVMESHGEFIVCLSPHCIPATPNWLERFVDNFHDPMVAGAYGRQIPMSYSDPVDKRDLFNVFGLDKRIQKRDTFFHNANSMFRRDVWQKIPFDESVVNIEDRIWAKQIIGKGYTIVYEPEAPVYHYHGINHHRDTARCENIVRLLEQIDDGPGSGFIKPFDPAELEVAAMVPLRQHQMGSVDAYDPLVAATIEAAEESTFIDTIVISADSEELLEKYSQQKRVIPYLRPKELSGSDVRVDKVLACTLKAIERNGYWPDLIVPLEITYPFRPPGLIDTIVVKLLEGGLDTVIAGFTEKRPCWLRDRPACSEIIDYTVVRDERKPLQIGLISLACATYPDFIRNGTRFGKNIGMVEVSDPLTAIEIRKPEDLNLFESLFGIFKKRNSI